MRHTPAPHVGQGANSALVDAAVLVEELEHVNDAAVALDNYEQRRRPSVRYVQRSADVMAYLSERRGPWARHVRDTVIPPVLRVGERGGRAQRRLWQEPLERLHDVAAA